MGHLGVLAFAVTGILTLWGINLSGLLVGAGFLSIVVGLAARETLGSVIAGFVLMFSRPFTLGDWQAVVRYDHDEDAEGGHDVTEEGLHRDIYRYGEKHRVEEVTGPISANEGFEYAEEDLKENVQEYIRRFERWHGVNDRSNL